MPKLALTPEQKAERKALKIAAEAAARIQRELEEKKRIETFKAGLPKRLMDAQALALKLGVLTRVELTETGPSVSFKYEDHSGKFYINDTLTYESEEWDVENIESTLDQLDKKHKEYEARRLVAQSVFGNLTEEQKSAVKEFIHYLR